MNKPDICLAGIITCVVLAVIGTMNIIPLALCIVLCMMSFVSTFLLLSNKDDKDEDEL